VLTFHKTLPNYAAVESHRKGHRRAEGGKVGNNLVATATDWPEFRGWKRDGHYPDGRIEVSWPTNGLRELWRQPVGGGYASFAIADGVAWTIEQRRDNEAVVAYDMGTGRELWAHVYAARFNEWMGGEGPRATPTFNEGRLYSLGAQGHLKCLDALTGRVLWEHNIVADHKGTNLTYGMAASPLVVDDDVIVLPGGPAGAVAAYHRLTGERRWAALSETAAYASPMWVELAGRQQLLVVLARRVVGLSKEGKLLWEYPWRVQYENSIAQPVLLSGNSFMISGGYGAGCAAVEITRDGEKFAARQLWRNRNLKNKFASSVAWQGHVYGLDEDILVCLNALTGERQWKGERFGYGQLLLAAGHLIVLGGDGKLSLVKADSRKFHQVAQFKALTGKTWNNPALARGRLLVRNAVEMACYEAGPR
jgi:outer membrane protein assembly factor BamB